MTKIISLSDEAYARLKALKGDTKSFTKVVIELTEKKENTPKKLSDYAGIWKNNPEMDKIFDEILRRRQEPDTREIPSW